jgi:hypothetical protein
LHEGAGVEPQLRGELGLHAVALDDIIANPRRGKCGKFPPAIIAVNNS